MMNMEEEEGKTVIRINLLQTAMTLGTYLGLYMILVYVFTALSIKYMALSLVSLPLMLGVPVVAFFLIKRFRDENCKPFFPFPVSWMLTILMFLFATALSCMAAYLYLRFIDNGAFSAIMMERLNAYVQASDLMAQNMTDAAQIEQYNQTMEQFKQYFTWLCSQPADQLTKQLLQSALVWSNLLSLIIGIIASKKIRINK